MGTKTMYETIMTLPLFQGVGTDHVSSFLEKTSIEFLRFSAGDRIVEAGEPVTSLKFLLSGRIRVTNKVLSGRVAVVSEFEGQEAIAPARLFGMHPHYDFTIEALDNVSLMEFSKKKYVTLLKTDNIYIMNFVNILSLHIQRASQIISSLVRLDLSRLLAEWLVFFTSRKSCNIHIDGLQALEDIYGRDSVDSDIEVMKMHGLVDNADDCIMIPDRDALIEYASHFG